MTIEELYRQARDGRLQAGPNGLHTADSNQNPHDDAFDDPESTKMPIVTKGTFHISLDELRRQVQQGRAEVDPDQDFFDDAEDFNPTPPQGVDVPDGTFHADIDYIAEFTREAPNAQYMGQGPDGKIWTEKVGDPVTGVFITLAYVTSDGGKTAEAYCVDPDMSDHDEDVHACHCFSNGRLCTDLAGVARTLSEKRARAMYWVPGFVNFLKTGRFLLDEE